MKGSLKDPGSRQRTDRTQDFSCPMKGSLLLSRFPSGPYGECCRT